MDETFPYSRVLEIDPATDAIVWRYQEVYPWLFFSARTSSAQRLPERSRRCLWVVASEKCVSSLRRMERACGGRAGGGRGRRVVQATRRRWSPSACTALATARAGC